MNKMMDTVDDGKGMTIIVKTVTRITIGFILLYGIYISLNGDIGPGGGFAGGVIIALSLVHVMLAFGKEVALKRLHSYAMRFSISIASLAFLWEKTDEENVSAFEDQTQTNARLPQAHENARRTPGAQAPAPDWPQGANPRLRPQHAAGTLRSASAETAGPAARPPPPTGRVAAFRSGL